MDDTINFAGLITKNSPVTWILAGYPSIGLTIALERHFLFLRLRKLPQLLHPECGQPYAKECISAFPPESLPAIDNRSL